MTSENRHSPSALKRKNTQSAQVKQQLQEAMDTVKKARDDIVALERKIDGLKRQKQALE